jgi:hypothetical protein
VPVLGTSGRVWLQIGDRPRAEPPVYDDRYTGRTRRLADIPLGEELVNHLDRQGPRPHFLDPAALAQGVPDRDVAGDEVTIAPDTPVQLDQRVAGVAVVAVYKTRDVADEAAARAALATAGFTVGAPLKVQDTAWTWEVAGAVDEVSDRLGRARVWAAGVQEKIVTHRVPAGELKVVGGVITAGETRVPLAEIARVAVAVPDRLPAGATVIVAGERPADYWWTAPLAGVLGLVALLMIWALVRALRPEKGPQTVTAPSTTST